LLVTKKFNIVYFSLFALKCDLAIFKHCKRGNKILNSEYREGRGLRPVQFPCHVDLYVSIIYVQSLSPRAATCRFELRYDKLLFERSLAAAENNGVRAVTVLMYPCVFI
jgi:hypothetical protein